jgi:hypothetical protein
MIESRPQECNGIEMASLAWRISHHMSVRLGCRQATLTQSMAAAAISWCAFEHPTRMAGIATGRGMTACQREASGHMIKGDVASRFFGQNR